MVDMSRKVIEMHKKTAKKYYFVGIGGSGMSSLAQVLSQRGDWVGGSDRNFDKNLNKRFFAKLQKQGIFLFPQKGSSIPHKLDFLVISTAIEKNNPEMLKATSLKIPVIHRAQLLSSLFNSSYGIGVAGTSGKSTVTGMVASVLDAFENYPTVINGGIIKQYISSACVGNAKQGNSNIMVSEIDESDGSIIHFSPEIGVITNISKDHKEMDELKKLFRTFASNTSGHLIVNADCPVLNMLKIKNALTFGLKSNSTIMAENVENHGKGARFQVGGTSFILNVPGIHNVYNALASIAVAHTLNIPRDIIKKGIASFRGIKRRLDLVGQKNRIIVIDDFAHNPDKIAASISALKHMGERVHIVFQPHGYGPTKFLMEELADVFSTALRPFDCLVCLNIFDAGGTASRTITSMDLLSKIKGPKSRTDAVNLIQKQAEPGDVVAVMGARDDTLSNLARNILRIIGRN